MNKVKTKRRYVIKYNGKYYTPKERWTSFIEKAWIFNSKTVDGFDIKNDFPKDTKVVPVYHKLAEDITEVSHE